MLKHIDDLLLTIINEFQPTKILVELDEARLTIIRDLIEDESIGIEIRGLEMQSARNDAEFEKINKNSANDSESNGSTDIIDKIASMQEKATALTNVQVGKEFFFIIEYADKKGIDIIPIDISLDEVAKSLSEIDEGEMENFISEIDHVSSESGEKKFLEEYQELTSNLNNPDFLDGLVGKLKDEMPGIYRILIADRNQRMAENISKVVNKSDADARILVVTGAGHLAGVSDKLAQYRQDGEFQQ